MQEQPKSKRKKIIGSIIVLIFVAGLVLMLGTYAYWQISRKQTNRNLVGSACLDITFSNETGDINLENMWPTSDSEGAALEPYSIKITNNCTTPVNYIVALESIEDDEEELSYLNYNYVKIKLDTDGPVRYGSLETITSDANTSYTIRDTKQLTTNTLAGGEEYTHYLRIWLSDDAPMSEMNKFFLSKLKITGGQGIESDECYAIRSDGTITNYNSSCGTSVTIPATINGVRVRRVASDAFKTKTVNYDSSGGANAAAATARVSSDTCISVNGTTESCAADFSIYFSNKLVPLFDNNTSGEERDAIMQTITIDDLYIVINDPPLSEIKQASFEDARDYVFEDQGISSVVEMLGYTNDDIAVYSAGIDELPDEGNGVVEFYIEIENEDGDIAGDVIGQRIATGVTDSLAITSLDLSEAIYLEKIEPRAFSNFPDIDSLEQYPSASDIPVGLTSLTFGENDNPIEIGGAAFAKADLDSLSIYNTQRTKPVTNEQFGGINIQLDDSLYSLMGPFYGSTIDSMTVLQSGDDTTYNGGVFDNRTYTSQSGTEMIGIAIISALSQYNIGTLTIGNGITEITSINAEITTINLPNSLTTVGNAAFMIYSGTSLTIPNSVTYIGDGAFSNYNGSTLTLPSNLVTIKQSAFSSYAGTGQSLVIPNSVTTIGKQAFDSFEGSTLTLSNSIETIGKEAFERYNGSDITIPSTITSIDDYAFRRMDNTKTITINRAESGLTLGTGWKGSASVVYSP